MTEQDHGAELAERVREAAAAGTPLLIRGGGTKAFYGRRVSADCGLLDVSGHRCPEH